MTLHGLEHLHKRRSGWRKYIPRSRKSKILDAVALANGIFGSLTALPQIMQIVATEDASGVSLLTWGMLVLNSAIWLLYGLAHHTRPIIASSSISIVLNVCTVAVILAYS